MTLDMVGFKFKIGQMVEHVSKTHPSGEKLLVVGRLAEECYGGVQLHYQCRPCSDRGHFSDGIVRMSEIELKAIES